MFTARPLEQIKQISLEKGFEFLESEYKNNHINYNFHCIKHDKIEKTSFHNIIAGGGLSCCKSEKCLKNNTRRKSLEEVKETCLKYGVEFLDNVFVNSLFRHNFKCLKHNETFKTTFKILQRNFKLGSKIKCCFKEANLIKKEARIIKIKQREPFQLKLKLKGIMTDRIGATKLSEEVVVNRLKERGFILKEPYRGMAYKHLVHCEKHNQTMMVCLMNICGKKKAGMWCCRMDRFTGKNHPMWNPNLTDEEREEKRKLNGKSKQIRKIIMKEDDYTCVACFERGGKLNVHHIYNWRDNKSYRYHGLNLITLCEKCHKEFHSIYGYRQTDCKQMVNFIESKHINNNLNFEVINDIMERFENYEKEHPDEIAELMAE